MTNDGLWQVFRIRHALVPIVVDWQRFRFPLSSGATLYITWRALYVFGIRIARWRVSDTNEG